MYTIGNDGDSVDEYNLESETSTITQTFSQNITDTTSWSCQACDSDGVCEFAPENRTITLYGFINLNETYNNLTIEGNTETFTLWMQSNQQLSKGEVIYNGISHGSSIYSPGGYLYKLDSNIIIPYVSAVVNKTFYWSITLADGSIINSSSQNQTILNLQVDNCSNYTTKLFNYTIVDEENQNNLTNTTLELYLRILAYGTTQEILNYTYSYNNTNPALVCLNLNLTNNSQYSVISTVKYQADDHAIEYYNVDNFTLQNSTIPQNITLYDLNSSKSIDFQVSFKDNYFLPVEGALIHIIRQYIPEGTFKTVEIPKTDTNGQTVAHLVRNDVVYNILVTKGMMF